MDRKERLQATVEGRVQGVCFRYYTTLRAKELRLAGWVRNEADGSVKVLAEGARDRLEELLEFLHQGPDSARVTGVQTEWQPFQGDLTPFSVAR